MKKSIPSEVCPFIGVTFRNTNNFLALIILLISYCLPAYTIAQGKLKSKVSLELKDVELKKVLSILEDKGGFRFVISELNTQLVKKITIITKDEPIESVLNKLLIPLNINYSIDGNHIHLKKVSPPKKPVNLRGNVKDAATGDNLPGATVFIKNLNKGSITDVDGNFKLEGLPPGLVTINVTYIGYELYEKSINLIEDENNSINIGLKSLATALGVVEVEAKRITNSEISVLQERKKSNQVQDAISAQEMERTGSITATQALQKVSGVSVKDGKYVAVRGLTERNVVVQLNGSRLSSADPLKSGAVPLDILPAQLLDNIAVQKTVLPDKPGDATGAIIELKTRSLPDTLTFSLTAQGGWNDNIGPGGDLLMFNNGSLGFWGQNAKKHRLSNEFKSVADISKHTFEDGSYGYYSSLYNKIRDGRNSPESAILAERINKAQEEIDPTLAPSPQKSTPNQLYSLAISNTFSLFGRKRLGLLGGINYYSKSEQIVNGENNRYQLANKYVLTPNNLQLSPLFKFREDVGSHNIMMGGVGIVTYKINSQHSLSGHYIFNSGFESSATMLSAYNQKYTFYNSNADFFSYQLYTSIRNFKTIQIRGEHSFDIRGYKPRVSWNYSTSTTKTDLPDFRNSFLLADSDGAVINNTYRNEYYSAEITRYFRELNEDNRNIIIDVTFPISSSIFKSSFKTGVWYIKRNRKYEESQLLNPTSEKNLDYFNTLLTGIGKGLQSNRGNMNEWLTKDAVGIAENASRDGAILPGYNYYLISGSDAGKGFNKYEASQRITALYGMIEADLNDKISFTGGVRIEDTDVRGTQDTTNIGERINTFQDYLDNYIVDQQEIQWLPSGTLVYKYNSNTNFRFAFSQTLARPEIVELVKFRTYDASQLAYIVGNNKLENSNYKNIDFRWEYFSGPGEVFSISAFYKYVDNALEKVFLPDQDTLGIVPRSLISFRNNPSDGEVYGVELEAVKSLHFINESLKDLRIGVNAMIAKSKTKIAPEEYYAVTQYNRSLKKERPLFEQPNFLINSNISYDWSRIDLLAAVYFNYTGKRLVEVNTDGTPGIYEYSAPQLDFIFTKTLFDRLMIKGFAKNLLNVNTKYIYQDSGNSKTYGVFNETYYRRQFARGREYAVGLSYVF